MYGIFTGACGYAGKLVTKNKGPIMEKAAGISCTGKRQYNGGRKRQQWSFRLQQYIRTKKSIFHY
jgi:hypothetical protein